MKGSLSVKVALNPRADGSMSRNIQMVSEQRFPRGGFALKKYCLKLLSSSLRGCELKSQGIWCNHYGSYKCATLI